jgi:hypothetical protein
LVRLSQFELAGCSVKPSRCEKNAFSVSRPPDGGGGGGFAAPFTRSTAKESNACSRACTFQVWISTLRMKFQVEVPIHPVGSIFAQRCRPATPGPRELP